MSIREDVRNGTVDRLLHEEEVEKLRRELRTAKKLLASYKQALSETREELRMTRLRSGYNQGMN